MFDVQFEVVHDHRNDWKEIIVQIDVQEPKKNILEKNFSLTI